MSQYKRILFIKLGAFGDFILTLGTMAALRCHHPDAHITLLTTKPFVSMAEKSGYFDHVWVIDRWPWWQLKAWRAFMQTLRLGKYDCVYDMQRNDRTRLFRALAPAALKKKWFSQRLTPQEEQEGILETTDTRGFPIPDMAWMDADIGRFGVSSPFILLVPGCSPRHPEKRWPAAHFAVLAQDLQQKGYTPVVLGTAAEANIIQQLKETVPGIHDLGGKTSFMDIAALARQASGAVGNDTGPMHLVAAVGCPVVSLFSGASSPAQSAPYGTSVTVLQEDPIENIEVPDVLEKLMASVRTIYRPA